MRREVLAFVPWGSGGSKAARTLILGEKKSPVERADLAHLAHCRANHYMLQGQVAPNLPA